MRTRKPSYVELVDKINKTAEAFKESGSGLGDPVGNSRRASEKVHIRNLALGKND